MKKNIFIGMLLLQQCMIAGGPEGRVETGQSERATETQQIIDQHRLRQEHKQTKHDIQTPVSQKGLFKTISDHVIRVVTTVKDKIYGQPDTSAAEKLATQNDANELTFVSDLEDAGNIVGEKDDPNGEKEEKNDEFFDPEYNPQEESLRKVPEAQALVNLFADEKGGEFTKPQVFNREQLQKELDVDREGLEKLCDNTEVDSQVLAKNIAKLNVNIITPQKMSDAFDEMRKALPVETPENKKDTLTQADIDKIQRDSKKQSRLKNFSDQLKARVERLKKFGRNNLKEEGQTKTPKSKFSFIINPLKGAYCIIRKGAIVVGFKMPIFVIATPLLLTAAVHIDMARAAAPSYVYDPFWATKKALNASIFLFKWTFFSKALPKKTSTTERVPLKDRMMTISDIQQRERDKDQD